MRRNNVRRSVTRKHRSKRKTKLKRINTYRSINKLYGGAGVITLEVPVKENNVVVGNPEKYKMWHYKGWIRDFMTRIEPSDPSFPPKPFDGGWYSNHWAHSFDNVWAHIEEHKSELQLEGTTTFEILYKYAVTPDVSETRYTHIIYCEKKDGKYSLYRKLEIDEQMKKAYLVKVEKQYVCECAGNITHPTLESVPGRVFIDG